MKSSVLDDRKIRDAIKDKWLKLPVQINQCDCEALVKQAQQKAYTQGCVDTKLYWEDEVKKARQNEITILSKMPIVLTKDRNWIQTIHKQAAKEGMVYILPEDAVLVDLPE